MVSMVIADTAAGESISNTANGTYTNPATGQSSNFQSNTVTIVVAEVAGIAVQATGFTENAADANTDGDGVVEPNEVWYYNYTVQNVGNDPTDFSLPDNVTINGTGSKAGDLEFFNPATSTWVPYTGRTNTNALTGNPFPDGFKPGEALQIRVPIRVDPSSVNNSQIDVELGDTPTNDGQNLDRTLGSSGLDLYTVDDDGNAGDIAGVPVNGVREASNHQSLEVAATVQNKPVALAKIDKLRTAHDNNGTTNVLTDDKLSYRLTFDVLNSDPTGNGLTPTALEGTQVKVDNTVETRILVSDAIPANTEIKAVPVAPSGWEVVYTTVAPGTADANAVDSWTRHATTAMPVDGTVTRIGFINTGAQTFSIPVGSTVGPFTFDLEIVDSFTGNSITVANIAQIFGETLGDPNNNLIIDESGDNNPTNYNDNGTHPLDGTNGDGIPSIEPGTPGASGLPTYTVPGGPADPIDDGFLPDPGGDGVPDDLGTYGSDSNNDNSGTGQDGEANVYSIAVTGGAVSIINGPANNAPATGPSGGTNDDFTNNGIPVNAADSADGVVDTPSTSGFTNTVQNNGTTTATYTLLPNKGETPANLPNGTVVEISKGGNTAQYTWDGTDWNLTNGATIVLDPITAGNTEDYSVEVKLPANTPVSTLPQGSADGDNDNDIEGAELGDPNNPPIGGYGVPIVAFIDDNDGNNGNGFTADGTYDPTQDIVANTTIDRTYLGYVRLLKESRVLQGTGAEVSLALQNFSTAQKAAGPGNIIEYRVTYQNISEASGSGTGNTILNASGIFIEENGVAGGNDWALDGDSDGVIDTSHVVGQASDSRGGTIKYYNGNPATTLTSEQFGTTANSDVTKYEDTSPNNLGPQESGNFTFQRKVN